MLLGMFSILIAGALAEQMPPKAGTYYCYTTTYTLENPVQVIPAFFGNLILDGKGHYTLTGRKTKGEYFFNKTTGVLSFTGDLKIMKVEHYTNTRFWLVYQGLAYDCGLQGNNSASTSSNQTNPTKTLNQGLTGKLLTTSSYRYNSFLAKVSLDIGVAFSIKATFDSPSFMVRHEAKIGEVTRGKITAADLRRRFLLDILL